MNRRNLLVGILAACAAPAIVRADSLMRIVPMERAVLPAWEEFSYQDNLALALNPEKYDDLLKQAVRRLADNLERDFLHALTRGSVVTVAGICKPRSRELQHFIVQ